MTRLDVMITIRILRLTSWWETPGHWPTWPSAIDEGGVGAVDMASVIHLPLLKPGESLLCELHSTSYQDCDNPPYCGERNSICIAIGHATSIPVLHWQLLPIKEILILLLLVGYIRYLTSFWYYRRLLLVFTQRWTTWVMNPRGMCSCSRGW